MTLPTDRERLDAIQRYDLVEYGSYYMDHEMKGADEGVWVRYDDVDARLAATEGQLEYALISLGSFKERAEHAEAALLSLQTTVSWQPIETAPKNREILVRCRNRAGLPGTVVAHYCDFVEDHPPIEAAWYFWNGCQFTPATQPTHWMPLPEFAAFLPDTAGTTSPKNDDDGQARVDRQWVSGRLGTAGSDGGSE